MSKLELRSVPTQERSRETFERILHEATRILDEKGWDGFNTNLLAEQCGCRVAAIYRYFPSKESVLVTLARRATEEWGSWFDHFDEALEQKRDFNQVWEQHIDTFFHSIKKMPGGLAIRRAMHATPELYELDQQDTAQIAARLSQSLLIHFTRLTRQKADLMAQILMDSAVALLDKAIEMEDREATELLRDLKMMHTGYVRACMT